MQINDEKAKAAFALFGGMMAFVEMAGVFASPRVWPKVKEPPPRERIREVIDTYKRFLDVCMTSNIQRSREPAMHFCALLAEWEPSFDPPPYALMHAARAFLSSWGVKMTDEEWDVWEGAEKDDAPSPDGPGCDSPV